MVKNQKTFIIEVCNSEPSRVVRMTAPISPASSSSPSSSCGGPLGTVTTSSPSLNAALAIPGRVDADLDGVGPDIIPANVVGGNDEAEEIARLLNQNIGVGAERKLQYLGEDVGQSPELLLSASHGGVRLRKRRSDVVSYRDVSFLGHRVNLHGFRTCELWANSEEMIPSSDKKRVISRNTERRTQNRNPKTKQKLLSDMQFSE
nr:hypothetical protein Iba_chr12cCG18850 [Ipomoea batatas]